jgi:hypothetical protein
MTRPSVIRLMAAVLAGTALVMAALSFVLFITGLASGQPPAPGFNGVGGFILAVTYPVVGWLLASRRPENSIGWLFLVIGLSQAGTSLAAGVAYQGLVLDPGSLLLADVASWLGTWLWVPGFVLLFVVILVFPDGHLPSRRWRPIVWLAGIAIALIAVPTALAAWPYRGAVLLTEETPGGGADPAIALAVELGSIAQLLVIPVAIAAVLAVILRFRRSSGIARQQLKWFLAAGAFQVAVLMLTTSVPGLVVPSPFDMVLAAITVPLIPIATGVAVLRYRLYEIDRIVSRTVSWALVTALLVGVFVVTVVGLQSVLASVTRESTLVVAVSTLLAAALFQPLRRRVQRSVDRRFNRAAYDATSTVDAFAGRLRSSHVADGAVTDLAATAAAAVQPTGVGVWLRSRP